MPCRPSLSRRRWWSLALAALSLVVSSLAGCGKQEAAAVDTAPFEAAIEQYLARNGMQLRIKSLHAAPAVDGGRARLSASMTHAELGGPSVVWEFEFEQLAEGQWQVVSHQD